MMDENILLNNKLKMLIKEERYEEAENLLEFVTYVDKNSTILNILGLLNYRRGFYKKSQEYFIESYRIDNNKNAQYYLDVLFENNNMFNKYYSALQLCKEKRYEDAKVILKQILNIEQCGIIYLTIAYLRGTLHERKKILRKVSDFICEDKQSINIYEAMEINYKSRVRRIAVYSLGIIVVVSMAALILV